MFLMYPQNSLCAGEAQETTHYSFNGSDEAEETEAGGVHWCKYFSHTKPRAPYVAELIQNTNSSF